MANSSADRPADIPAQNSVLTRAAALPYPFRIETSRPYTHTVLVGLHGEFDQQQVPRMRELLECRLRSTIHTAILDLMHVSYVSVDAIDPLLPAPDTVLSAKPDARKAGDRP